MLAASTEEGELLFGMNMLLLPTLKTAGLILAAGEPHKNGTPNGLLPLGNGETSATRLAAQMQPYCRLLFCLAENKFVPAFKKSFEQAGISVILIQIFLEESNKLKDFDCAESVFRNTSIDWVHQVSGDLVFEAGILADFLSDAGITPKIALRRQQSTIDASSLAMDDFCPVAKAAYDEEVRSEIIVRLRAEKKLQLLDLPIIADVSTPEGFAKAQAHFASSN